MNTRTVILDVLKKIYLDQAYSHLVLQHALKDVSSADKALITNVVYGTIQNQMYVRYQWQHHVKKKVKDPVIAILLDISVYQLLFLERVPAYAIVNEAVELAKKQGKSYGGFVNGVLQNVIRGTIDLPEDEIERLALQTSHPVWLVNMWIKHYGLEATKQICLIDNLPPRACARVNTLHANKEDLLSQYACSPGELSEDALYFDEPIVGTMAFQSGEVSIQDEASQMVAIVLDPKPHDVVLDVCAAPGSKTVHMANRMNNLGRIVAQELHPHRSQLIVANCEKLGIDCIEVHTVDSRTSASLYPARTFTHVLVDAPCSGFGVMRRKPDIKFRANQEELDGLLLIQSELLECVHDLVQVGGALVYSTCTLNKNENERQVAKFLAKHDNYKLVVERTILPFVYDCDGFYIAKLLREK